MKLTGQHVLITGGSSGMGLELSKLVLAQENELDVFDTQEPREPLPNARFTRVDLTRGNDVEKAIRETMAPLDVLVNNAGILGRGNLTETTEEEFDRMFGANVKGSWLMLKHTMTQQKFSPNGTILQMCSTLGLQPKTDLRIYSLTKQTIHHLIEALREEHPDLTVKAVYPGAVKTPMTTAGLTEEQYDRLVMERWGVNFTAMEMAERILALIESDTHRNLIYDPDLRTYHLY